MNPRIYLAALLLTACRTPAPAPEKPAQPLITRQAEPLVAPIERIQRDPATTFAVQTPLRVALEDAIRGEADSNELIQVVGLSYGARQVLLVAHVRYPTLEMDEAAHDSAVNDDALEQCEDQFPACADGLEDCDDTSYQRCLRAAYSDPFVYYSSHLGVDCGVVELSRYAVHDGTVRLEERRTLEPVACDFAASAYSASARDVDLDGGPEVGFAYTHSDRELEDGSVSDVVTIVDAEDLHVQARLVMSEPSEGEVETAIASLRLEDRNGDTFPDLVAHRIQTVGEFCPITGWTVTSELMEIRSDQGEDKISCQMRIREEVTLYDPATDTWGVAAPDAS